MAEPASVAQAEVSKVEQVQARVAALASQYGQASPDQPGHPMLHDLDKYEDWLAQAHEYFRSSTREALTLSYASEWVLDNYYIIRQALRQLREDLPPAYYTQLPKLTGGAVSLAGYPRIYAMVRDLLVDQNLLLNMADLETILSQIQDHVPLTMGELWAVPIFLRYSIIEALAHALLQVIQPRQPPDLPDAHLHFAASGDEQAPAAGLQVNPEAATANCVLSLRAISEQDWNTFFEAISRVEHILHDDPAEIYPQMDFKTRDHYRKAVEQLAKASGQIEPRLAESVLELAREGAQTDGHSGPWANRRAHVGYYLLDAGRAELEARSGYRPGPSVRLRRWAVDHAGGLYIGAILLLTLIVLALMCWPVWRTAGAAWQRGLAVLMLFIPATTIANSLVSWAVTRLLPPRVLPKMNFRGGIPEPFHTLVVIPALITSSEEVRSLVRQLEMHYLRNPNKGLSFALLTDFGDADSETLDSDQALVDQAIQAVDSLNQRYSQGASLGSSPQRFYFLHRKRVWNSSEGRWMGWERKRGKLHELNRLLLSAAQGGSLTRHLDAFPYHAGDFDHLRATFVITLDADTVLQRGAAQRLAGTLAHPLNQAIFDPATNQVVSGYSILQPRMEISPDSANHSWFARIFAGDTGLDLYSRAVSDVYQDLNGEGIFVGKGIYDVAAFERSVKGHIPDNRLLSHDLLEGLMGRAGLVTDITMIEDYPPNYFVQALRQHRWTRGDWQLLPWLFTPGRFGVHFSLLDRWKMLDNLRRSLIAPALVLTFILGLIFFQGPLGSGPGYTLPGYWAAILLLTLGIPVLTSLITSTLQAAHSETVVSAFRPITWDAARWLLALTFLPYEAFIQLDAILVTLVRVFITHRGLLRWTTAAHTARLFRQRAGGDWWRMIFALLLALLLGIIAWSYRPNTLADVAPVLLLWALSPLIARRIDFPLIQHPRPLTAEEEALLRRMARRTWAFFERFVGPEDHWLPPDHYQESPVGIVAHQTSPTNIGLLLNSTLAAYDLGYIDMINLLTRLSAVMDTLDQLERFRGHFLNWYDTLTLQPLHPRYVSTVDSGNLSASLIIVTQTCRAMVKEPIFRWALWQGYMDSLSNLAEIISGLNDPEIAQLTSQIQQDIDEMNRAIQAVQHEPDKWYPLFQRARGQFWGDIARQLGQMLVPGQTSLDRAALRSLQDVANQVEQRHLSIQRKIDALVPWIPLLEDLPERFKAPQGAAAAGTQSNAEILQSAALQSAALQAVAELRAALPYSPALGDIRSHVEAARSQIARLRQMIGESGPEKDWLDRLETAVQHAVNSAGVMLNGFNQVAERTERFVNEMDFKFLYNPQRRIFHIGYNLDAGQLDNNYYDLLASEARITSLIAIARGEVPQVHWLQLARPVTQVNGLRVLLSWSATMFEYLMPPLFLRAYPNTLLTESAKGAVIHQIAYGRESRSPWGISESGFYRFDANQNYQYRAFGVPGLGFKRGLSDDLVIAPYASLMAISYDPQAVLQNIQALKDHGALGVWGFYEAIDFTQDRLLVGQSEAVVREYMAHHQGMVMMALDNFFKNDINVKRMHADPRIQSVELLLQEQIPFAAPLQSPYTEDVKGVQRQPANPVQVNPWPVPVQTPIPQVHLLSNGDYSLLVSNAGGGYSSWKDTDLTRWQPDGVLDPWGSWIYVQDMERSENALWSAATQPVPGDINSSHTTFHAHMVVFRRENAGIITTTEVTVQPDDPVEIRRLHINNTGAQRRLLRICSYGEVILGQQSADARHPAFNKLFIQNEWVSEYNLQIFKRRPRSQGEAPVYLGHMLVLPPGQHAASDSPTRRIAQHEGDRARFIGRGSTTRSPVELLVTKDLSGTSGATLDPIFAIGQEIPLAPHASTQAAYLTFAAASRAEILALAGRYQNWALIDQSFHQADLTTQSWLGQNNLDTSALSVALQTLSALIFPFKNVRAAPEVIAANRLGQPGLWRFGISGDYPILLVDLDDPTQLDLVREALQVHRYLRSRRFLADVVILNHQQTDYGAELNSMLYRLVSRVNSEQWLNQRGGVYILHADQLHPEELTLLRTAARVLVQGQNGSLADQVPGYSVQVQHLPEFTPTRQPQEPEISPQPHPLLAIHEEKTGASGQEDLQFFNGYGGFSADGLEYVINIQPGKPTPAPWVNVIGYPQFGFMVSESGSMCTWAYNSGENRLTPWFNDPVRDPTGEALYLRDEETGEIWTPTPLPAGVNTSYQVRHGAGYTVFEHESHELAQHMTVFGSPENPVKIIHLRLTNRRDQPRRLTATQYVEWVLGIAHNASAPYIIPEYDPVRECLLASNPYNTEFSERTAFMIACEPVHGVTADRAEFLGRGGSRADPAALHRIGLETRITPGEDPCGVLQIYLELPPNGSDEVYFVIGQASDRQQALDLADKYHEPAFVGQTWERTHAFWERLLDAVQVKTPAPATNLILNRWLLYQALSCRIWGRTAFYQSSGAFGFRDQLQDVLALLPVDPGITRAQILNAAQHQFEAGDVLHWWHPPSGRGVRTRFSDDLLWLPYVTSLYIEATGDRAILDEKIPFRQAPPLRPGEDERYDLYPLTQESYPLFEHCRRAIEKGATLGPHRLPLIGTGDWNDGLNRVGIEGRGESVWLAWFLYDVLMRFAAICEADADDAVINSEEAKAGGSPPDAANNSEGAGGSTSNPAQNSERAGGSTSNPATNSEGAGGSTSNPANHSEGAGGTSGSLSSRQAMAADFRAKARAYAEAVEKAAWDGAWYRRAYYDDGSPLGSIRDPECEIDSIAQSWSILSGAAEAQPPPTNQHARRAMQSVLERLVRPEDRLVLLFSPPFDRTPRDPGYIKGYLPGTRENGGQYTHAATWTAWAFNRMGDGQQAGALFDLLNPILQSMDEASANVYRVEPYVICADIYSVPPYVRRGGWTWYTGSAAWMYRLGLEAQLGFQRLGDRLKVDPVIPPAWDGFEIDYRFGQSSYHIQVRNPDHIAHGIRSVMLDGAPINGTTVPLQDDGYKHTVEITMGKG